MGPGPYPRAVPRPESPDISPLRLTPIDVVSLTEVEVRAIVLKLAGHSDPVVAGAVVDVTRDVLEHTRGR